jgi:hypothetical protein
VDNEIIQQLIEWDCNVSSETYRAIIYCLTWQSVSKWHQLPIMWHA